MKGVTELICDVSIPRMVRIKQNFDRTCIPDGQIREEVQRALANLNLPAAVHPGMRIAITCGSRGIYHYAQMARTIVEWIKRLGAEPFIVAAMGSHGGATEVGQKQILADYGITEGTMGCPVLCQMQTVEIGKSLVRRLPVYLDKNAANADGILLFNRIKPHTSFSGRFESGLMKMMAIGLGKQKGAESIHGQNPAIMHELIEEYGKTILKNCPVLGGIAVIENAYDRPCLIRGVPADRIEEEEPRLLQQAYQKMAKILLDRCDVLVVDRIGKNISGDGMDPNITGRFCTKYRSGGICAQKVVALDLTEETHGNAQGVGLADVTTRRLYNKMKLEMTYPTGITNTFLHLMKIPMIMDNDREAIQLALHSCSESEDRSKQKMIRIPDTAHIEYLEISLDMLEEACRIPDLEMIGEPYDLPFDAEGNLPI